jgi:hypothetical protein
LVAVTVKTCPDWVIDTQNNSRLELVWSAIAAPFTSHWYPAGLLEEI